ncbi:hypothetical protein P8452_55301 [Trifolium repens]|nr:hypothetical protein P8452_55301 [Trifolium repens]
MTKEHIQPHSRGTLAVFEGSLTQPIGFVTLPIMFENKGDTTSRRTIHIRFFIMPCDSGYNRTLGMKTLKSLKARPLMVHFKMQYYGKNNGVRRCLWMTEDKLSSNHQQNEEPLRESAIEADFGSRVDEYVYD